MAEEPKPGENTPPPPPPPPPAEKPPAGDPPPPPVVPDPSKAGDPPPPPAAEPPASYELTVPDDAKAIATPEYLEAIKDLAKVSKWSNADAQASLLENLATAKLLQVKQQARALAEAQADPDYGGLKLGETQENAKRLIDAVRPAGHARREKFLAVIGQAGNNIEVLSFLADLGARMKEDAPRHGQPGSGGDTGDIASKLYDNPTSKL